MKFFASADWVQALEHELSQLFPVDGPHHDMDSYVPNTRLTLGCLPVMDPENDDDRNALLPMLDECSVGLAPMARATTDLSGPGIRSDTVRDGQHRIFNDWKLGAKWSGRWGAVGKLRLIGSVNAGPYKEKTWLEIKREACRGLCADIRAHPEEYDDAKEECMADMRWGKHTFTNLQSRGGLARCTRLNYS